MEHHFKYPGIIIPDAILMDPDFEKAQFVVGADQVRADSDHRIQQLFGFRMFAFVISQSSRPMITPCLIKRGTWLWL